ncbi:M4 family metallopeptidase [Chitinophaga silvisoli]|uniref:T9SS C-terminal target domain-containing protein n=1 Tax=Chitinophaga silvisoli TaxID=2291814 RepID=A0A3E1NXC8_9BACT|nr:M4 family metallopeptidase [Chitinophaga silvisoli]RFM32572.1 T9SS C-terminal target domain-containing protein [Chitinophaga silvisoli]
MKKTLLFFIGFLLPITYSYAQTPKTNDTLSISKDIHGRISALSFKKDSLNQRRMANDKDFLNKITGIRTGIDEFRLINSTVDKQNITHRKYQLYYKNVKIEYAQFMTHGSESLQSLNGTMESIPDLNVSPGVDATQAIQLAMGYVKADQYAWQDSSLVQYTRKTNPGINLQPVPELLITRFGINNKDSFCLAWKVNITSLKPTLKTGNVYINASNGSVVKFVSGICNFSTPTQFPNTNRQAAAVSTTGQFRTNAPGYVETLYSGVQGVVTDSYSGGFRLAEVRNGVSIHTFNLNLNYNPVNLTEFSDNDNVWGASEHSADRQAFDIHWAVENLLDYYSTVLNRNSMDNNGIALRTYAHWGTIDNSPYTASIVNAAYIGSFDATFFGDGGLSGGVTYTPLTSSDIVYHELKHMDINHLSMLEYAGESGALNESLADINGAVIEFWKSPNKIRWSMGEEVVSPATRFLNAPNNSGSGHQPDTKSGTYYIDPTGCNPSNTNDNCYVHTNSGVINYWFYLLSEGGSGTNDLNNSFNVTGIGIEKAAAIVHQAEYHHLLANTQFSDWRDQVIASTRELYPGGCEEIQVTNAFYAVGIGSAYVYPTMTLGNTAICGSTTAALSSVPNNSTVTWSVTPALVTLSATSGAAITVTPASTTAGTVTLTAQVTLPCGTSFNVTKSVKVNAPTLTGSLVRRASTGVSCGWDVYISLPAGADYVEQQFGGAWVPVVTKYNSSTGGYECILDNALPGPATYSFTIRAVNGCGTSAAVTKTINLQARPGNCASRLANLTDSTNKNLPGTLVYPNPANGKVTVSVNADDVIQAIEVYSFQGSLVQRINKPGSNSVSVDFSGKASGTYIIRIISNKQDVDRKVVIQH